MAKDNINIEVPQDPNFEVIDKVKCLANDGRLYDLNLGVPQNAEDLFRGGNFPHIGLKPTAKELFKNDSDEELIRLVNQCRRKQDVKVLASVKDNPSDSLKNAIQAKLSLF